MSEWLWDHLSRGSTLQCGAERGLLTKDLLLLNTHTPNIITKVQQAICFMHNWLNQHGFIAGKQTNMASEMGSLP